MITKQIFYHYNELTPAQKAVLQLLSVVCTPMNQTQIIKSLSMLGIKTENDESFDVKKRINGVRQLRPILDNLIQLNFLNDSNRSAIKVQPDIIELIAREVSNNGLFQNYVDVLGVVLLWDKNYLPKEINNKVYKNN
jgi:hypothetical protein